MPSVSIFSGLILWAYSRVCFPLTATWVDTEDSGLRAR